MRGKAARVAESEAGAERLNNERDLQDRTKQFALQMLAIFVQFSSDQKKFLNSSFYLS
jgi:hypothetical protein